MSVAASIIEMVRASGGEITLADDRIRLKVPASIRDEVVVDIKTHREAVRFALKRETDGIWDAVDYHAFYEERAAIAEYDGGRTRAEAEAIAYECVVVEWLNRILELSHPGRCAWCGGSEQENAPLIPFGTRAHMHTWLHLGCWDKWYRPRRDKAVTALAELGISQGWHGRFAGDEESGDENQDHQRGAGSTADKAFCMLF